DPLASAQEPWSRFIVDQLVQDWYPLSASQTVRRWRRCSPGGTPAVGGPSMRRIRLLAALAALAFTAGALAQTTLTFWSWRTEDVAAYEKFIEAFREENPDIDVEFTPYLNTEYNTILATALQGGGGP